jgi:hypothetical protein
LIVDPLNLNNQNTSIKLNRKLETLTRKTWLKSGRQLITNVIVQIPVNDSKIHLHFNWVSDNNAAGCEVPDDEAEDDDEDSDATEETS